MKSDKVIRSATAIRNELIDNRNLKVPARRIRKVLKNVYGANFSRIRKVPLHANSLRNLYMRQQFSIQMLDWMLDGKRILCVDETWFGETNFLR